MPSSSSYEITQQRSPKLWDAHSAMVAGLADTEWHSQDVVIEIMVRTAGIRRKTAANLIGEAARTGTVIRERRGRHLYIKQHRAGPC